MFESIKRDTDKARKADGGSFITQTGEYVVWIGQAAAKQTTSGASLIEFTLKDVRTSALCTTRLVLTKASGDEAFGMGMLHALMTILGIAEITRPSRVIESLFLKRSRSACYFSASMTFIRGAKSST